MSKEQFLSDIETLVSDFSKGKQRYDWGTLESGLKVAFMRSLEPVPLAAQASPAPEKCVLVGDGPPMCSTHDTALDWVECEGWRCPNSGFIFSSKKADRQ